MDPKILIERLRQELPPVFTRKFICKFLGGYLTPGGLANMDCAGIGHGGVRVGKVVVYEKEHFLTWLSRRLSGSVA